MPYICQPRGDAIHIGRFKRHFCVAAFPGERSAAVYDVVSRIYEQYDPAERSWTPTSPPPAIRPSTRRSPSPSPASTSTATWAASSTRTRRVPGVRLVDAFDAERERLARHLGSNLFEDAVRLRQALRTCTTAPIIGEALRSSPHADWFATADYLEQVCSEDIIYAFVPMVRLGEALGMDLPVTRAMVEVMGVMLQRDYWSEGCGPRRPRSGRARPRGRQALRDDRRR